MFNKFRTFLLNKKSKTPSETFTFYIPAPPKRRIGYREKQFDKMTRQFFLNGYNLIDTKIVSHNGKNQEGFWIIFIVNHPNKNFIPNFNFPTIFEEQADAEQQFDFDQHINKNIELDQV